MVSNRYETTPAAGRRVLRSPVFALCLAYFAFLASTSNATGMADTAEHPKKVTPMHEMQVGTYIGKSQPVAVVPVDVALRGLLGLLRVT
jgi:hypothetical protein